MLPQNYVLAGNQTMTPGGDQLIGNFVTPVLSPGTYKFTVDLNYETGGASGTPNFAFHGPAAPSLQAITGLISGGGGEQPFQVAGSSAFASVVMTGSGDFYNVNLVYAVTTTAAGTVSFQGHASANTFTVAAGAAMTVMSATLS